MWRTELHCVRLHHWFSGLDEDDDDECNDKWGPLILMGISALNATVNLTKSTADPFSPTEVPLISVLPPTPDTTPRNSDFQWDDSDLNSPLVGSTPLSDITSQVSALNLYIDNVQDSVWRVDFLFEVQLYLVNICGSILFLL
jgi:hypothetical protein